MRTVIFSIMMCFAMMGWAKEVPTAEELPEHTFNYYKIEPNLAIAGKPSLKELEALHQKGVEVLIDLRTSKEDITKIQTHSKALGLAYYNIPISGANMSMEDVEKLSELLKTHQEQAVVLHCASGNRASGLWALVRIHEGAPVDVTLKKAREAGLGYFLLKKLKKNHPLLKQE